MGSGRTGAQDTGGYGVSDDTYGSSGRTGGGLGGATGGRGGDDFSSSGRTGGGLGQDDTYGSSGITGGRTTGQGTEFGENTMTFWHRVYRLTSCCIRYGKWPNWTTSYGWYWCQR